MSATSGFQSVFDQVFDVVVFGAGYAGLAACSRLANTGRTVLLVDRGGDAAWESGRAMSDAAGQSSNQNWNEWIHLLAKHGCGDAARIAPAPAEVVASGFISRQYGLRVLYYAAPVDVEHCGGRMTSVILATKAGLRRVAGRQFVDTTETGELLCLLPGAAVPRTPARQVLSLYLQHHQWADDLSRDLECPELTGAKLHWRSSFWASTRCLRIDLPGSEKHPRGAWLAALQAARDQLGGMLDQAVLTHGSVMPLPVYDPQQPAVPMALPDNVACASPALSSGRFASLAERYELGDRVAAGMDDRPEARVGQDVFNAPLPDITPRKRLAATVAVAGLGTGGLLAAVAAGRETAGVVAFDPLPFAGGIGTGGGIHIYYHGVKGGLQDELDERTRRIMPLFGPTAQVRGFHPDAKKIVADAMLREAGVTVVTGFLTGVGVQDGSVREGCVSTPQGMIAIDAPAWIDATGDGDLAAMAGAEFQLGRHADGQLHAYSQSSGRAGVQKGVTVMHCINYDAGFVDPTDPEDLTRGRLLGISHYEQSRYAADDHPTYIAPAIGLRQARQMQTDYVLTLADLIERRRFDDCVGYTGCHYDNHAVDYELESDEAMFWVWVCRQWRGQTACEIPYRSLLPRTLNNVWMACRALGVSIEAHSSMRMQRDMQRVGEVSGLAAAMAVVAGVGSRGIAFDALTAKLAASGAVKLPEEGKDHFGNSAMAGRFSRTVDLSDAAALRTWAKTIEQGDDPRSEKWWLYRAGREAAGTLVEPLLRSAKAAVSWRAAAIMAMWGDVAAQPRLCAAIVDREYGCDDMPEGERPEKFGAAVPRWMAAVALLRACGDAGCLPTLRKIAAESDLIANVRASIAITCRRIVERCQLTVAERDLIVVIMNQLTATEPPLLAAPPRRVVIHSQPPTPPTPQQGGYWKPFVTEDFGWQMHLEIARTRIAVGHEPHKQARKLLCDERLIVRRAAARLLQAASSEQATSTGSESGFTRAGLGYSQRVPAPTRPTKFQHAQD